MQEVTFDLQPTLQGKLITVRPLNPSDYDELFAAASDPLIWEQHPFPRNEREEFDEFFNGAIESKSGFIILDNATQKIIGATRFYNLESDHVFLGYTFLARAYWGGTFNHELKKLLLDHAFKFVDKVCFDIGETNLRSRRAIEKIGARFVKHQLKHGKPYTIYEIKKPAISHGHE
jgi:RimJ/RimL family protein N-acetyltransferase